MPSLQRSIRILCKGSGRARNFCDSLHEGQSQIVQFTSAKELVLPLSDPLNAGSGIERAGNANPLSCFVSSPGLRALSASLLDLLLN
jgi:hypothetical protein